MVHDAGALGDFPDGELRVRQLGRHEVGVIRRGNRVFAIRNHCPHQGAPVCAGRVGAWIGSRGAGTVHHDAARLVLACPWHGWEFDVQTGRALWDDAYRVKTYDARIEDGRVMVEIGSRARA